MNKDNGIYVMFHVEPKEVYKFPSDRTRILHLYLNIRFRSLEICAIMMMNKKSSITSIELPEDRWLDKHFIQSGSKVDLKDHSFGMRNQTRELS